jgi:hypothetical protein
VIHSSSFNYVRSESSEGTLGGAVYVGVSSLVNVDGSTFSFIENIGSGGGLYISNSETVTIFNCYFINITVSVAGGMIERCFSGNHYFFFFPC